MLPAVAHDDFTLYVGDVREVLAQLPDESVDCVVTSPPYWGTDRDASRPAIASFHAHRTREEVRLTKLTFPVGQETVTMDEKEIADALRVARFVFTTAGDATARGQVFAITWPSENAEEDFQPLYKIGGRPGAVMSRAGSRRPDSPLAEGFKSEIEWRFPPEIIDIARRVADEMAVERGCRPSFLQGAAASRKATIAAPEAKAA